MTSPYFSSGCLQFLVRSFPVGWQQAYGLVGRGREKHRRWLSSVWVCLAWRGGSRECEMRKGRKQGGWAGRQGERKRCKARKEEGRTMGREQIEQWEGEGCGRERGAEWCLLVNTQLQCMQESHEREREMGAASSSKVDLGKLIHLPSGCSVRQKCDCIWMFLSSRVHLYIIWGTFYLLWNGHTELWSRKLWNHRCSFFVFCSVLVACD